MYVRGRESNTLWVESKSVKANGENLRAVWVKFSTLR
jgi:hypothetical protein